MAFTTISSTNSLTVKRWEMETWIQAMRTTAFGHAMNRGSVYFAEDFLGKDARGDGLTMAYAAKLIKAPIGEGGTLDGNEEALNLNSMTLAMNVQRIGVLNPNRDTIEQQRTFVDFDAVTRRLLTMRMNEILDTSFFTQLAGYNGTSLLVDGTPYNSTNIIQVTGQNPIIGATANRIIYAGNVANDQSLTSSNRFTLDLIDVALESASLTLQPVERLDDQTYDLYLSPEQLYDLQHDSSGKIQWYLNAQAKAAGGDAHDLEDRFVNDMVSLGRYRSVNIYEMPRVSYGFNSSTFAPITTVRRAVLLGRNALAFASPFGGRASDDDVPMRLYAQFKDYDYYKGMEARFIGGLKKMSPANKDDIGVIVISTYAAPHSAITY